MDKKFVSAESEMSALSTFEQNETLRAGHFRYVTYRKKLRLASYNNVQKRNDRYHSEFSGAGVSSIPVPEFRLPVQQWSNSVQKRGTLRWDRPSRNQLPHHGDHAAPAGLHGVAAGAQC